MKKIILIVISSCLSIQVFSQSSFIPYAQTLSQGGVELEGSLEYFGTTKIADKDGAKTNLSDGAAHSKIDGDLMGRYGVTDQLELVGGVRYRYINTAFSDDFGGGSEKFELTTSGMESFLVGAKYGFRAIDGFKFGVDGYYRYATYSNKLYDGSSEPEEVAFGEGSRDYGVGGILEYKTKSENIFEAKVQYRSPGETLSKELFSLLRFGMVWTRFSLYAGLESVTSMGNDPHTGDLDNKELVFNGSSGLFNSVNRQWTAPFMGMGIAMGDKWRLTLQSTFVTEGRSTDLGSRFLFSITRRADKKPNAFAQKNNKFKQYRVEGVVEKLSKSRKVVVVDKGKKDGVEEGMKVDFFYFDFQGENKLIATGKVMKLKYGKSLVQVIKRYSRRRVEKGTVARLGELSN